jgi:hypothetical protein
MLGWSLLFKEKEDMRIKEISMLGWPLLLKEKEDMDNKEISAYYIFIYYLIQTVDFTFNTTK